MFSFALPRDPVPPWLIQPERSNRRRYRWALDRSLGLSPFQGWKSVGASTPVVSPPAIILSSSGAGEHSLECYIWQAEILHKCYLGAYVSFFNAIHSGDFLL
jgi:hypothetical protein